MFSVSSQNIAQIILFPVQSQLSVFINKNNSNLIKLVFPLFSWKRLYYIPKQTSNISQNEKKETEGAWCYVVMWLTYPLTCFLKMLVTDTIKDRTCPCIWSLRCDVLCFCLDCRYNLDLTVLPSWVSKRKPMKTTETLWWTLCSFIWLWSPDQVVSVRVRLSFKALVKGQQQQNF